MNFKLILRTDLVLLILLVLVAITATRNDQRRKKEVDLVRQMYKEEKKKVEKQETKVQKMKEELQKLLENSDKDSKERYSELYDLYQQNVEELVEARAELRENFKYWYMITGTETVVPDKQLAYRPFSSVHSKSTKLHIALFG